MKIKALFWQRVASVKLCKGDIKGFNDAIDRVRKALGISQILEWIEEGLNG